VSTLKRLGAGGGKNPTLGHWSSTASDSVWIKRADDARRTPATRRRRRDVDAPTRRRAR
jgi:hypothetical protein